MTRIFFDCYKITKDVGKFADYDYKLVENYVIKKSKEKYKL